MMKPGDTFGPDFLRIDPAAMRQWAAVLHDPNPIHLDPEAVARMGLGNRVINQGPANVAYLLNLLMKTFPGCLIKSLEVRFVGNVFGGDVATAAGVVTSVEVEDGLQQFSCDLDLSVEGVTVLTGKAAVLGAWR